MYNYAPKRYEEVHMKESSYTLHGNMEKLHDLIIHEMFRQKGKAIQHNRKTKQHNTTRPRPTTRLLVT